MNQQFLRIEIGLTVSGDMDCGSDSYRSRDPAKVGSITCRKER